MADYQIKDFMPHDDKGCESVGNVENVQPDTDTASVPDEPVGGTPHSPAPTSLSSTPGSHKRSWSSYVSAFFSPLLVPTYAVALAMWITPLSGLPERPRLGATFTMFLITAVVPMAVILTMISMGRLKAVDIAERRSRFLPTVVSVVCLILGAVYLRYVHAPSWLYMIPTAFAVSTFAFLLLNFRHLVSGHTLSMGTLTGVILYLGIHDYIDMAVTPWIAGSVILTGLVSSARLALGHHTLTDVTVGAVVGLVVGFFSMYIPII